MDLQPYGSRPISAASPEPGNRADVKSAETLIARLENCCINYKKEHDNIPKLLKELSQINSLSDSQLKNIAKLTISVFPHLDKSEKGSVKTFISTRERPAEILHEIGEKFGLSLSINAGRIKILTGSERVVLNQLAECVELLGETFPEYEINIVYSSAIPLEGDFLIKYGEKITSLNDKAQAHSFDDTQLKKLTDYCPNLQVLLIRGDKITERGLEILSSFKSLQVLSLSHCSSLTSIDALKNLSNLTTLFLPHCDSLRSVSLESHANLMGLFLSHCKSLTTVDALTLTNLAKLQLYNCPSLKSVNLKDLTGLTQLDLQGCSSLTSISLKNLKSLTELNLSGLRFLTSVKFQGLTSLMKLNLSGCSSLKSLDGVKDLMHLTMLSLSECRSLTEEGCLEFLSCHSPLLSDLFKSHSEAIIKKLSNLKPSGAAAFAERFLSGSLARYVIDSELLLLIDTSFEFYNKRFPNHPFDEILKKIINEGDKHIKKEKITWLAESSLLAELFLDEGERRWFVEKGIASAIYSFGRPELRSRLTEIAISAAASQRNEKTEKYLSDALQPWQKLTRMLLSQLHRHGAESAVCKKFTDEIEAGNKLFYIGSNSQVLIDALLMLANTALLNREEAEGLVEKIYSLALSDAKKKAKARIDAAAKSAQNRLEEATAPGKGVKTKQKQAWEKKIVAGKKTLDEKSIEPTHAEKQRSILYHMRCLSAILLLGAAEKLKPHGSTMREQNFDQILKEAFQAKLPIGEIENFSDRYLETFGSCREPLALITYMSKINTLSDSASLECLEGYVKAVLTGTFSQKRYETTDNPHLKLLDEYDHTLLEKWKESIAPLPLGATTTADGDELFKSTPFNWLTQKLLTDRHFADIDALPLLKKYLESGGENQSEQREQITQQCLEEIKTKKRETTSKRKEGESEKSFLERKAAATSAFQALRLQDLCIKLARAEKKDVQRKLLADIDRLISKNDQWRLQEFSNDLKGTLQSPKSMRRSQLTVVDSDNPYDLLLCGSEVSNSCQRLDGNPALNKGLLGYLVDGKIRLVAVKDERGRIAARCLLRILWDGKRPVLFQSRRYYRAESKPLRDALDMMAIEKAKALGTPLVCKDGSGKPYGKTLYATGGPSPWEYCDDADGEEEPMPKAKGEYKISDTTFVPI